MAEGGESALIVYNDEVEVAKPFGSGDLQTHLKNVSPSGHGTHIIDAGLQASSFSEHIRPRGPEFWSLSEQPIDSGSKGKLSSLREMAEQSNTQIYALKLPIFNKAFVTDSFKLEGLSSQEYRGGYRAVAELTRVIPALRQAGQAADSQDPFSYLALGTGGLQLPFRKQSQLENDIIALGDAVRSRYVLSYVPDQDDVGFHQIKVSVNIQDAAVFARPGYRSSPG